MASSYTSVTAGAPTNVKSGAAPVSVYIHRHTCDHCGKWSEREVPAEMMHTFPYPYLTRSAWHAKHAQSLHYTMNVLLVVIVVFLTFIAAKFLFGK